ncbi:hypothetical protein SUVZ_04G2620 [Saccharomyces uvarum]|uniref:Nitrogen regulatory protein areA GATA-like domain-containing protein n=1 Tax=Saccharomyces uvarum TaxID=230603 RepID=A0ABN8WTL4_SACUV|nr:hypothetical protein SUVZ_04G2620 [Saccharomyces uvarum]
MTLSNCASLDNLFYDPPEEEKNSKFIEAVRTSMSKSDMGSPSPVEANGKYCLRKVKSLNAKQWKINKKKYNSLPAARKKKYFDFYKQRNLILNLNLWKFIKFINCNGKNNYDQNNKHVKHLRKTVKNDDMSPLQEAKKMDNDKRLENIFWRSWFKAHKKRDTAGCQRERHIRFNDNVEQCIIANERFIQKLPPTQLNTSDDQDPGLQLGFEPSSSNKNSKRVFYDYNCVYVASDTATAIINSSNEDPQHKHDICDVPSNILPREKEADLSSVLRVDPNLNLSNITHHSPAISSSSSGHSTFIFESETETETETDTDTDTTDDSIPTVLL